MTATSVLYTGHQPINYQKFDGLGMFFVPQNYERFTQLHPTKINQNDITDRANSYNFVSDKIKVFVSLMNGPYHFLHDALGGAIQMIKKFPDAQFIFDTSAMYDFDKTYLTHWFNTLTKKKIDFKILKTNPGDIVYANNFYFKQTYNNSANAANNLFEFFQDDFINKDVKPFRTIYLSRRHMGKRDYSSFVTETPDWDGGPSTNHDTRMFDEFKLEEYLSKEFGVEIVVPEDFKTFADQINHFYETKTVISMTSSGLTCSAFMQPGSNVIEIMNTMVVPLESGKKNMVEEALHLFYISISFIKNHNYFSIQNKTRKAEDVIKRFENTPALHPLLRGEV